ncbi:MAG: hypothetical protein QOG88_1253 [Actinomycetota bacterium]|jgi:hypothetical protein|nr:hypothetical protein [Actinomycetota bacterium]
MHGQDHSQLAQERRADLLASPAPSRSHGTGGDTRANGGSGSTASACAATVTDVRVDMPSANDAAGIAHALAVLELNCAKDPQAHGLINALQKMGHGKGHTNNGHGGGPPPGHTNNGHGGHPNGHTNNGQGGGPPDHPSPPPHTNNGNGNGNGDGGGKPSAAPSPHPKGDSDHPHSHP